MNESEQSQQQQHVDGAGQISNGTFPYSPHVPFVAPNSLGIAVPMPTHPRGAYTSQQQQQQQRIESFWADQMQEAEQASDFKNHMLPLARVKKIMKADEDVRMISSEAPVVFAKACEMFISELTLRAWTHTEEGKRKTLQKNDIVAAISKTETFDFLVDVLPRDEFKEEFRASSSDPVPYYYLPPHQHNQQHPETTTTFVPWPQQQQQQQTNQYYQHQEYSDNV